MHLADMLAPGQWLLSVFILWELIRIRKCAERKPQSAYEDAKAHFARFGGGNG